MNFSIEVIKVKSSEEIFDSLKENNQVHSYSDIDTILFLNEGIENKIDSFIKIYTIVPKEKDKIEEFKYLLKNITTTFKDKLIILEIVLFDETRDSNIEESSRCCSILEDIDFIDINEYYKYADRYLFAYNDGPGLEFGFNIHNFLNHQKEKDDGNKNN